MATDTLRLKPPQQLYQDWERAHWAAQDVDLGRDAAEWAELPGELFRATLVEPLGAQGLGSFEVEAEEVTAIIGHPASS